MFNAPQNMVTSGTQNLEGLVKSIVCLMYCYFELLHSQNHTGILTLTNEIVDSITFHYNSSIPLTTNIAKIWLYSACHCTATIILMNEFSTIYTHLMWLNLFSSHNKHILEGYVTKKFLFKHQIPLQLFFPL